MAFAVEVIGFGKKQDGDHDGHGDAGHDDKREEKTGRIEHLGQG
jgi:hypothetical protein